MGRKRRRKPILEKIEIYGLAEKGRGVGRDHEGRIVFVERVIPGDIVDVQVLKKKESYYELISQREGRRQKQSGNF